MQNTNREKAKQILSSEVNKNKQIWGADGIDAFITVNNILDSNEYEVKVKTDEYAVYDGSDGGNYTLVGKKFKIDINKLVEEILDNVELFVEDWSVPTLCGSRLDIYLLL